MLNIKKALVSLLALSVAVPPASASLPATQLSYDSASRVTAVQTGVGATTNYDYDGLGNLASEQWPGGGVIQYAHKPSGGLSGVVDPRGIATSYVSNGFGEATAVQSPDAGLENRTYDEAGNLKSRSFGTGATQHFSYDADNRLTSVNSGDAQTTFQYDTAPNGAGRLASMQDNSGATSWAYDVHGNVVSRSQSINGAPGAFNLNFSYDAGRVTSITYPSGRVVSYIYDASRVTGIKVDGQTVISNVQYQPFGPPISWQMGAIGTYSRSFDTAGRIVSHTHENGQRQLTWDAANRPTSMQNPDGSTWTFGYDALNRLTSANQGVLGSRSYILDWVGNRTSVVENGTSYAYGVDSASNRLTTAAAPGQAFSYAYDGAGRIIGDGVRTFNWTNAGLLASATKGPVTGYYTYNGFEQRVKKTVAQGARYYVYAEDELSLLGEYQQDAAGGTVISLNEIVFLEGIPVAVLRDGSTYYVLVDHLETPRSIKSATGATVWAWTSDVFGNGERNDNPSGIFLFEFNSRFPGQQYDAETGMHYNNARYYSSQSGRYISSDPAGLAGGVNGFVYSEGSPVLLEDRAGLWAALVSAGVRLAPVALRAVSSAVGRLLQTQPVKTSTLLLASPAGRLALDASSDVPGLGLTGGSCLIESEKAIARGFVNVESTALGYSFARSEYIYAATAGQNSVVKLKLTGSYSGDFKAAEKLGGFSHRPPGYTWHHVDDFNPVTGEASLELVASSVHAKLPHKGGVFMFESHHGVKYK